MHPQGARIYVNPDGSMEAYSATGKAKKTSATPEKLAAGHGAWAQVGGPGAPLTPSLRADLEAFRDKANEAPYYHDTAALFDALDSGDKDEVYKALDGMEASKLGSELDDLQRRLIGEGAVDLHAPASVPAPAPALTETSDTPAAVASVLAPMNVSEPETKSVKVTGPGKRIPMEYKEASTAEIDKYIADPDFMFQQKVDGIRGQLVLEPGKAPWFRSKSGDRLQNSTATKISDPIVKALGAGLPPGAPTVNIDGELLNGQWHVFDMTVDGMDLGWEDRMKMAEGWVDSLKSQGVKGVSALPTARTPAEKRALFDAIRDGGGEGVVMKRRGAKYKFGQRTSEILKAKNTSTADTVVMERNVGGKDNAVVGMYRNGKLERVANVSTIGKGDPKVGDVLEVEYLWAHPESRLLTQARIKGPRPDKNPLMVTDSQLKFVNKDVLDGVPAAPTPVAP